MPNETSPPYRIHKTDLFQRHLKSPFLSHGCGNFNSIRTTLGDVYRLACDGMCNVKACNQATYRAPVYSGTVYPVLYGKLVTRQCRRRKCCLNGKRTSIRDYRAIIRVETLFSLTRSEIKINKDKMMSRLTAVRLNIYGINFESGDKAAPIVNVDTRWR